MGWSARCWKSSSGTLPRHVRVCDTQGAPSHKKCHLAHACVLTSTCVRHKHMQKLHAEGAFKRMRLLHVFVLNTSRCQNTCVCHWVCRAQQTVANGMLVPGLCRSSDERSGISLQQTQSIESAGSADAACATTACTLSITTCQIVVHVTHFHDDLPSFVHRTPCHGRVYDALPPESRMATARLLQPKDSSQQKACVLHLAGTGDHTWSRRMKIGAPLVKQVSSLMLHLVTLLKSANSACTIRSGHDPAISRICLRFCL